MPIDLLFQEEPVHYRRHLSLLLCAAAVLATCGTSAAQPSARSTAGVAVGAYECWANGQARMLMNFTIRDASHYAGSDGSAGTFSFDAATTRITFKGGSLDGVMPDGFYAIYHSVQGRSKVSFMGPGGAEATFCDKS